MSQESLTGQYRTPAQIAAHYEIEKELANKLRHSTRPERQHLYPSVHDELYRRVPDHPLLLPRTPAETARAIRTQVKFVKRFVNRDVTFLDRSDLVIVRCRLKLRRSPSRYSPLTCLAPSQKPGPASTIFR